VSDRQPAPQEVLWAVPVANLSRATVPDDVDQVRLVLEGGVELGPALADGSREVSVGRAELREPQVGGDPPGTAVVPREVFRVVHLDAGELAPVSLDVLAVEADRQEAGMGDEHDRVLRGEFGHRPVEREEVGDWRLKVERQHVSAGSPVPGEQLPTGDDEQFVVAEAGSALANVRPPREVGRVDDGVQSASLRSFCDGLVEYFHVEVDARAGCHARMCHLAALSFCGAT
jgi:hypothetical protein